MNISKKQMIEVTETLKRVTEQRDELYDIITAFLTETNPLKKKSSLINHYRLLFTVTLEKIDQQLKR